MSLNKADPAATGQVVTINKKQYDTCEDQIKYNECVN